MTQPVQLSLDFEAYTPEEFAGLVTKLIRQARKLQQALKKHDAALRRARHHAEQIAGCSLDGWDEETLVEYVRLFLGLQNVSRQQ